MSNTPKKETQIIGNTGLYYVCYKLSSMGLNVMPTARNARGIDVVAYSPDGEKYCGIQVKTLSRRNPVPLGKDSNKIMGNFWVVVVLPKPESSDSPAIYVLKPDEVKDLKHTGINQKGKTSYWLHPDAYDKYKGNWDRIREYLGVLNHE